MTTNERPETSNESIEVGTWVRIGKGNAPWQVLKIWSNGQVTVSNGQGHGVTRTVDADRLTRMW